MNKKLSILFLSVVLTFSSCASNLEPTPDTPKEPDIPDNPLTGFSIEDQVFYQASYEDGIYTLKVLSKYSSGTNDIYFSYNKNKGLDENNVFNVVYQYPTGNASYSVYDGQAYEKVSEKPFNAYMLKDAKNGIYKTIIELQANLKDASELSFYPMFNNGSKIYNFSNTWEYMRPNFPQTWLYINNDNKEIEYDKTFETQTIDNWSRPSLKALPGSQLAYSCSEDSLVGARVSAICAERMGATVFDLHLEPLYNSGQLDFQNMGNSELNIKKIEMITKAVHIPVLAIFYDGNKTQDERLLGLKEATRAGAAAVDLQGFMGWVGSTINTQTEENIKKWESRGFDMSFVSSKPKETILDEDGINMQIAFINDIHALGGEVLLSSHNQAVYNLKQVTAYAKFVAARGVDVIKLVGHGYNVDDINACIEANKTIEEIIDCRFSFHFNGDDTTRITRLVCPLYYGAFLAFCYQNMTHLNMMVDLSKDNNKPSKDADLETVIAYMKQHTTHSELDGIIETYRRCPSFIKHVYHSSSDRPEKWTNGEDYNYVALRDSSTTNKFNARGYTYNLKHGGTEFSYTCSISGQFYPYVSTSGTIRIPKVGIMIGDGEKMLAFVYRTNTKKIDLMYNYKEFGLDDANKGDSLVSCNKITSEEYTTDVTNKGIINMGVYLSQSELKLYFSEGEAKLSLVGTIPYSEISNYLIPSNVFVGSILELYLGSESIGKENYINYNSIKFESGVNIV